MIGTKSDKIEMEIDQWITTICGADRLAGNDPYDIWMTPLGIAVKKGYNKNKYLGLLPAAAVTLWDHFPNNSLRLGYQKREYPAARAMAASALLIRHTHKEQLADLKMARAHLDWLLAHSSTGYSGLGWGLGFKWAADDGLDYDENTPFSTHTPYVLEAMAMYTKQSGNTDFLEAIRGVYDFFEKDIKIMLDDGEMMATSYGPTKDRLVTNAVSYALYAYALFLEYLPEKRAEIAKKITKLNTFIRSKQRTDGSWLYEPDTEDSFIDCFHSCFVIKNLHKANALYPIPETDTVIKKGYSYVKKAFYCSDTGLFKRFSIRNKPGIISYDLYDNAEMLQLAVRLGDLPMAERLFDTIYKGFVRKHTIYSAIDIFGHLKNPNSLRWAVIPFLYAASMYLNTRGSGTPQNEQRE